MYAQIVGKKWCYREIIDLRSVAVLRACYRIPMYLAKFGIEWHSFIRCSSTRSFGPTSQALPIHAKTRREWGPETLARLRTSG